MYNLVGLLPLHGHQAPITNYSGGGSPIWNWEPATGKSAKIPPILVNHTVHRSPKTAPGQSTLSFLINYLMFQALLLKGIALNFCTHWFAVTCSAAFYMAVNAL